MSNKKAIFFGEVVESSLQGWIAQSWQWNKFPQFGSIVTIEDKDMSLFGIVHQIQTGSIDSNRQTFTYKKTEEELLQEQPQIFELLKTNFSCLVLGYQENGLFLNMFAPKPAKIHAFIRQANIQEIQCIFKNPQYLQLIFSQAGTVLNLDELLLALLKNLATFDIMQNHNFEEFIQTFSLLTKNDYCRLKLFLQRIEPILKLKNF